MEANTVYYFQYCIYDSENYLYFNKDFCIPLHNENGHMEDSHADREDNIIFPVAIIDFYLFD